MKTAFARAGVLAGLLLAAGCSPAASSSCPAGSPDSCGGGATAICTSLQTDRDNCGTCGNGCGKGEICVSGSCAISCPVGQSACPPNQPTYCATFADDPSNCGGCGVACAKGQVCNSGTCTCPSSLPALCGSGTASACTNVATDPANCGACSTAAASTACLSEEVCSNGSCVGDCLGNESACPATGAPTYCADLQDDPNNCGACGQGCAEGQICQAAAGSSPACVCPVGSPDLCGSACTDTQDDPNNCGGCSTDAAPHVCGVGELCAGGVCQVSCPAGQAACPADAPTYCADLTTDLGNCGACGAACVTGQQCTSGSGGVSACACPAAQPDQCGSSCTNTQDDPDNCGGCTTPTTSHACPAGEVCASGACQATCEAPQTACPTTGTPTYCATLTIDPNNCGSCGTACVPGQVCTTGSGHTGCACPADAPTLCGSACTSTLTDPANCGGCSTLGSPHACSAGQVCTNGTCEATCEAPQSACPATGTPTFCTNLKSDSENCGTCGTACSGGEVCTSSGTSAACACPGNEPTLCGSSCTNTKTDTNNCGGCTTDQKSFACPAGDLCESGHCAATCAAPQTACPATGIPTYCANLGIDVNNCGACGNGCEPGQLCQTDVDDGLTGCACPANNPELCGSSCTNTQTDTNNCGGCTTPESSFVCPAGDVCVGGGCQSTCPAAQSPCPATGVPTYCADLSTDVSNCGSCGVTCGAGEICTTLDDGSTGCGCSDSLPDQCSGSCTDFLTDPANCGGCSTASSSYACGTGQLCSYGVCQATCEPPQTACPDDGTPPTYCADLATDLNNCGYCGDVCAPGQSCASDGFGDYSCECPAATPNLCNDACTNLQTDANNCGGCSSDGYSTACEAGEVCLGGICQATCVAPQTACPPDGSPDYCANLADDVNNCGACGAVCLTGQSCVATNGGLDGQCTCPANLPNVCDESCTNLLTDVTNCGTCGTICLPGQVCSSGSCKPGCESPQTMCPTVGTPTYCADLTTDLSNCGTCGNVCSGGQLCGVTTPGGTAQCACPDNTPDFCEGACTNVLTDSNNCNDCSSVGPQYVCPTGESCQNGTCEVACLEPETVCTVPGGASPYCANLSQDFNNCGGCGNTCVRGQVCKSYECQ